MAWSSNHIETDGPLDSLCWIFQGNVNPNGYGYKWSRLKAGMTTAHRAYYHEYIGTVGDDDELILDHLCRNKLCVNPDHMDIVDHSENALRGLAGHDRGSQQRSITICPSGHEYTPSNTATRTRPNGKTYRSCRECERNRSRQARLSRLDV